MAEREKRHVRAGPGLYDDAKDIPHGTPTPTQEELNQIKTGEHVNPDFKLAEDGSGPDPYAEANLEAQKKHSGVITRQGQPERTTQPRPPAQPAKPPGT